MPDPLTGEWTTLRTNGEVAYHDENLKIDLQPRVDLEYTARVSDPDSYALIRGMDPDDSWLPQVLLRACEGCVQERTIFGSMSGAYDLPVDVTPLANTELAPMGVEVAVSKFDLALSDEDRLTLDQAAERAALANLDAGFVFAKVMKSSIAIVALASPVLADPAIHSIVRSDGQIVADTPSLTLAIRNAYKSDQDEKLAEVIQSYDCQLGLMTNVVVSWHCSGVGSSLHDGGGGAPLTAGGTWEITSGKLAPVTYAMVFKTTPAAATALAKITGLGNIGGACTLPVGGRVVLQDLSIQLFGDVSDSRRECEVLWTDVAPYLQPTYARIAAWIDATSKAAVAAELPASRTSPKRFVAGTDSVRDTQTGLEWASHDNGADLDAAAAEAYAKAYRGGGHDDWRLPTADELAGIATPDLARREPKDCTGGKSSYEISPLIHISCGLAWSSTPDGNNTVAFGFISGSPRASKRSEKKNYRALVVRVP